MEGHESNRNRHLEILSLRGNFGSYTVGAERGQREASHIVDSSKALAQAPASDKGDASKEAGIVTDTPNSLVEQELDGGVLYIEGLLDGYALIASLASQLTKQPTSSAL